MNGYEISKKHAYFMNKLIEVYLQSLIKKGIPIKEIHQKYKNMEISIFVREECWSVFEFETKIVEYDGKFNLITNCTHRVIRDE